MQNSNVVDCHSWRQAVREATLAIRSSKQHKHLLPLVLDDTGPDEVEAAVEVLLSGQLSMSDKVAAFEAAFAKHTGSPYAVMVNSGSSANLLALAVASNRMRSIHLKPGDEVLVPAVCWSTSVWPIAQMGLVPVFVDVDPLTMNIDTDDFVRRITPKTRGVVLVHILGNAGPMSTCLELAQKHNLVVIEDTCESLGSTFEDKMLGTMGDFGTYSFFFSHHMTTGEGGMVTCKTLEDYDLLKCLRAHGWTRMHSQREMFEKQFSDVDPRFLFINMGYNLRPMEISGALGLVQLRKLPHMNSIRVQNRNRLVHAITSHPLYKHQISFPRESDGVTAMWFGFPMFLSSEYAHRKSEFLTYLSAQGIENRPIVSGNFVRQPGLDAIGIHAEPSDYPGAEAIHHSGLFIGLHAQELSEETLQIVANTILAFF